MERDINQSKLDQSSERREGTRAGRFYKPAVDILEAPEALEIYADLPGSSVEKIHLNYDNGQLSIHAEVAPRQEEKLSFLNREYGVADYHRTFTVDERIDGSKISATYEDGVLKLILPKAEDAKPRKIVVKQS